MQPLSPIPPSSGKRGMEEDEVEEGGCSRRAAAQVPGMPRAGQMLRAGRLGSGRHNTTCSRSADQTMSAGEEEEEEKEEDVARRGAAVFSQGPARRHKVRLCLPPRVPDKGILVCAGGAGRLRVRRGGTGEEGGWISL